MVGHAGYFAGIEGKFLAGSNVVERLVALSCGFRRAILSSEFDITPASQQAVYSGTQVTDGGVISRLWRVTHHDAACECDAAAAVRVGHDVTVSDTQQRDGDQPH